MYELQRTLKFDQSFQTHEDGCFAIWALPKDSRQHKIFVISPKILVEVFGLESSGYSSQILSRLEDFRSWVEMACENAALRTNGKQIHLTRADFPSWLSARRLSYMKPVFSQTTQPFGLP